MILFVAYFYVLLFLCFRSKEARDDARRNGAAVRVPNLVPVLCTTNGVVVERPLHVVALSTGAGGGDDDGALATSHPSLVVQLGEGASLSMLQQYSGEGAYFTNAVTRLQLGANASLTVDESAAGIMTTIEAIDLQVTGCFRTWLNEDHAW